MFDSIFDVVVFIVVVTLVGLSIFCLCAKIFAIFKGSQNGTLITINGEFFNFDIG